MEVRNGMRYVTDDSAPTLHLKQGTEAALQSFMQSEGMQRVDSRASAETRSSTPLSHITTKRGKARQQPAAPGKWTKADENDLERLGQMLSGFLASEIFNITDFRKWVKQPLRGKDGQGPAYGAVDRIRQIMSAVMVKHRPGVIDTEVALPPSTVSMESVRLTHWSKLTYNSIMALIAANVYTSEGQDPDYLLHPKNAEALNTTEMNMRLVQTWFTSMDMDLDGGISRTTQYLEKKKAAGTISEERARELEEALNHMRRALHTPAWREWMENCPASVPFSLTNLPVSVTESWSESPDNEPTTVDAHSLIMLRKLNTRGREQNMVALAGWDERAKRPQAQDVLKQWREGTEKDLELARHRNSKEAAAEKPNAPKVARNKHYKVDAEEDDLDARLAAAESNAAKAENEALPRPLPNVVMTSSYSGKVNWIVRAILTGAPDDQFIIFSTWEDSAHLTEAFDLAGIKSVYAGSKVNRLARNRAIADFRKGIRVCILELKFGGRGLDLTCANRMIFMSPVWNPDIQAQAMKVGGGVPRDWDLIEQLVRTELTTARGPYRPETPHRHVRPRLRGDVRGRHRAARTGAPLERGGEAVHAPPRGGKLRCLAGCG